MPGAHTLRRLTPKFVLLGTPLNDHTLHILHSNAYEHFSNLDNDTLPCLNKTILLAKLRSNDNRRLFFVRQQIIPNYERVDEIDIFVWLGRGLAGGDETAAVHAVEVVGLFVGSNCHCRGHVNQLFRTFRSELRS